MPAEFWREVVDRVAAEVPDTLLLAEAFWLLEGYFVRTLGMHRVYNSAFMHMLRDEDNAGYRRGHQEDPRVRSRDPQALRQLHDQPGRGDRGRAVREGRQVLRGRDAARDPARAADVRPRPDRGVRREVRHGVPARDRWTSGPTSGWSPATSARSSRCSTGAARFAEADDFLLYDFVTDGGGVDEDVFAYSNGSGPARSLVVYHNRFGSTSGWIRDSAAVRAEAGRRLEAAGAADARRGPGLADRSGGVRRVPRRPHRAGAPAFGR